MTLDSEVLGGAQQDQHVGLDFGTSNSSLAAMQDGAAPRFTSFELLGAPTQSYRSLLFFDPEEQESRQPIVYTAGVEAIEAYLEAFGEGRLIQSFKSHLASATRGRTRIGHHNVSLDDMVALFLVRLRAHAERQFAAPVRRVLIGRPVRFVGARSDDDDAKAEQRLREAALQAGFEQVRFELEPIAAAFHYERALARDELALIADFGGGTTDFCLMRLGPGRRDRHDRQPDIVTTWGVGVAGDDLDAAIIDHLVCPHLGKGGTYLEMNREHAIPASYYFKLSRWHHLSFLKGERTQQELLRLRRLARDPEAIGRLEHVIEANQGFHLHKSVERVKIQLSSQARGEFFYEDGPVSIRETVQREDFEQWIADCTRAIAGALDETLQRAGVTPAEVDRVFMTGGTASVPVVRRIFAERFGAEKLSGGDELTSIASGLAQRSAQTW